MTGLFGYDGYIYQTIVIVHVALEWILSDCGLSSIFIEVEDKEGEFSVDLVLVSKDLKKVTYCEIKGGRFSASDCLEKLKSCSNYFKKNNLITKNSFEEFRIIYRQYEQLTKKEHATYGQYLMYKPNNLLPKDFRKYRFGFTETMTLSSVSELIKKLLPDFDSEREKTRIYLSLSHFIETEVRALAEKLRSDPKTSKFVQISLEDILMADDSFAEVISAKNPDRFSDKEDVTAQIINKLKYGATYALRARSK